MSSAQDTLTLEEINSLSAVSLVQRLERDGGLLSFDLPMSSIGFANDPADIAIDYLHAAHFGQQLAPFCETLESALGRQGIESFMRFSMKVRDFKRFGKELRRLAALDCDDMPNETADLFDELFKTTLHLPELGDAYMANFLHGSLFEEECEEWLAQYPIWEFDIWRSFASGRYGCDFFTSDDVGSLWIVLGDKASVETMLPIYGGLTAEGSVLFPARALKLTAAPSVVVSPHASVELPVIRLNRALHCLQRFIAPDEEKRAAAEQKEYWGRFAYEPDTDEGEYYSFRWFMTENGDTLVCGDDKVSIVLFCGERLRPTSISKLLTAHEATLELMCAQTALSESSLNWLMLTPSSFEDLCYDVILRCGRFDERTIRKHGKTNSRDGGRDIEVWTIPKMGHAAEKWIFQCKYVSNGRALSAARVSISDVIDQYGSDGFGIMTNEVIDSTLYDKLDAISSRRGVLSESWDGSRLQRFLSLRRDLLQKHFEDSKGNC